LNVFRKHGFSRVDEPHFVDHVFDDWRVFKNLAVSDDYSAAVKRGGLN
jgi:L-amino acid N-acyltransferase YncA